MAFALVTGGSGYFGSLLVRSLLVRGDRVRIFDLVDADDRPPEVEFAQGDIRDERAIRAACAGFEVVHHNVAQVPLAKDAGLFWSVNVEGTRNLMEACLAAGVRKVIHMSSSAVYGVPSYNPVDDSVVPSPKEAYGKAKYAAELVVHEFVGRGLDVTVVRPRTILGHGRLGIFQILFEWISEGKNVYVLGRGNNRYQFVHADDLADSCIRASHRTGPATYNIGTDRFGTMRETLEGLIAHANTRSRVVSVPFRLGVLLMDVTSRAGFSPLGAYHTLMYGREMFFDISNAVRELEWSPKWSNLEMFCQSYDWYLENRNHLSATPHLSHHRRPVEQRILRLLKRFS